MWAHCSQYVGGPIDDALRWLLQTALEIFLCMPHAPRCSKVYSRPYAGWPIRATNHSMLVRCVPVARYSKCAELFCVVKSHSKKGGGGNESLKIKTEEQRIKTDTIHFARNFIEARKVRPQVKNDHDSSGNPARSSTPVLRENSTP